MKRESPDHGQASCLRTSRAVFWLPGPSYGKLNGDKGAAASMSKGGEPRKQHGFSLELVSELLPESEVVFYGFLQAGHRRPPGQGRASSRSAVRSTLA